MERRKTPPDPRIARIPGICRCDRSDCVMCRPLIGARTEGRRER